MFGSSWIGVQSLFDAPVWTSDVILPPANQPLLSCSPGGTQFCIDACPAPNNQFYVCQSYDTDANPVALDDPYCEGRFGPIQQCFTMPSAPPAGWPCTYTPNVDCTPDAQYDRCAGETSDDGGLPPPGDGGVFSGDGGVLSDDGGVFSRTAASSRVTVVTRDSMTDGLSNAELIELDRRYGFYLRRRCRVLLRDAALADDAMQEILMKLLRHGATFREAPHPMRWLYRVTDHACIDLLRRGRRARQASPIEDAEDLVHPGVAPDMRRAALDALALLDEEEQKVAVMTFVDGMTQQEIADELGYSRVTVNKRVAALRERLDAVALREKGS